MRTCQFCGAELPDEASFCLQCASVINSREKPEPDKQGIAFFKRSQRYSPVIFGIVLSLFIAFGLVSSRFSEKLNSAQNPSPPQTTLVPVTQSGGETVTDANGNAVYEVVDLEPSTQKQSILQEIISNIKNAGNEENTSEDMNAFGSAIENNKPSENTNSTVSSEPQPSAPDSTQDLTEKTNDAIVDENPSEVFEYVPYERSETQISITKYKGNSAFVTIPDYIDGLMVVELRTNAFLNNSKVQTVDIPKGNRAFLWLRTNCFNNCSSLLTINLYNNDLGTLGDFSVDCPIKDVNISFWQYKFVDGALYYNNGKTWEFRYFAGNPCYTTLTLQSWCRSISNSNNLDTAKNLKVINIHKNITSVPTSQIWDYNQNLEAFNVEAGNPNLFSKDGVLFWKSSNENIYTAIYPYGKKDQIFTMPSGDAQYVLYAYSNVVNPYLTEIYLPINSYFSSSISTYYSAFPNLKKIHLRSGHPSYDKISAEFTGETLEY